MPTLFKITMVATVLFGSFWCRAQTTQPAEPSPRVKRVLIISVDGMRPDMMLRCKTPAMHGLLETGSFTCWARTTALSVTLPSHTSMLTGVDPRKHGIDWNRDLPFKSPVYPNPRFPTIFELAIKHGYSTAMAAGKSKFHTLAKPGTLDWEWITDSETTGDAEVAEHAVSIIRDHQPQVMFVHLPSTDNIGHARGWGSHDQAAAIEGADEAVGKVLAALVEAGVRDQTVVFLTADHGGAGRTHGPDDPRSRHIPWIVNGPGICKNLDLTTDAGLTVHIEDTFATACYLLGLPRSPFLDGKPVLQVLQEAPEMLREKPGVGVSEPAPDRQR